MSERKGKSPGQASCSNELFMLHMGEPTQVGAPKIEPYESAKERRKGAKECNSDGRSGKPPPQAYTKWCGAAVAG